MICIEIGLFQTNDAANENKSENTTSTENETQETANDHKERGNESIKTGNFTEAILHYSFAIKLDPNEATFYSNRSLAFLKLKQLYYANEDAEKAIQLKPDWAKVIEFILVIFFLLCLFVIILNQNS